MKSLVSWVAFAKKIPYLDLYALNVLGHPDN
jgi:hypothetical protein